ncbi:hypothetical protein PZB75_18125 [Streptomyces sp. AM 4-1-1]|uniref:hypothetical protein n=1 Tax=Streptomyces sp. AM 4-1-1 TaxID=3028710 RepID=UPI0023BA05B2|nr:hypothetical protein [Streptomyces sp. AM 4-1-1]WEH35106.1 hypothetical protein PZB75_18125 [Streptomyces sp. AM 4-1-1]
MTCVVRDLDGTVRDEVTVESRTGAPQAPRAWASAAIGVLAERGALSGGAGRTAPSVLPLLLADPAPSSRFVAPQVGRQDKGEAPPRMADGPRMADRPGTAVESLVLVDGSAYERAEAGGALPGRRCLADGSPGHPYPESDALSQGSARVARPRLPGSSGGSSSCLPQAEEAR